MQQQHLLRDEYRIKKVTKVSAQTLEELVEKMESVKMNSSDRGAIRKAISNR